MHALHGDNFEYDGKEFKETYKTDFASEGVLERKHIQAALRSEIEINLMTM